MATDPVRAALYGRLTGDATLRGLASGGLHHRMAPSGTAPPYLLFQRQAGTALWTFQDEGSEQAVWLVKGICRGASATKAEEIDDRCQALLHSVQIAVTGGTLTILRESAVEYGEDADGECWHHVGSLYRFFT